MQSIYDFSARKGDQKEISFSEFRGKTLLIVNTASKCGYTGKYSGLEKLYQQFKERNFEVIAFPCDQFAHQEPGTDAEIAEFCTMNHGVTFPLMSKIKVNGSDAHPLFKWLKLQAPGVLGNSIKWNFTKFLVEKDGKTVHRFAPKDEPSAIIPTLEEVL